MTESSYKIWNRSFGWIIFLISLTTFSITVEPTASFWDAGEYISTSAKLQIGHPPGAPLYQMLGAFFALFSGSAENVALSVNFMSVLSSSFAVLFLFWTLTLLLKKLPAFAELENFSKKISFFGSASVGALALCFSDSFWFNAVEAEVYGMATLILSLLFWLGLRWESEMDTEKGDRWLLLISFIIGLSFGVHFMGLLTIPAIGMIYYFKNYKEFTIRGFILANIVSVAILLFIFKLLLPLTLAFFGNSEVFFVNSVGLPFNSGTIIAGLSFILFFYYTLKITARKKWVNLNTGILCILFVLIGFSSWIMIPIRANANTVINENSPSDARLLLAYYNMEQYPETHLFYGPMFSDIYAGQDELEPYYDDKPKYERDTKKGEYIVVNNWENARINSNSKHRGFLPRLWSPEHAANYMNFTSPLDFEIALPYRGNEMLEERVREFRQEGIEGNLTGEDYHQFFRTLGPYLNIEKPSFWNNIKFLFEYQIGYMYVRYFMWNFVGRQNDRAGTYDILDGNWISGINFLDTIRLGNQNQLNEDELKNKARNTYFFLPLILGLIGIYFLFYQDKEKFWILLLFFLFTGLALKFYLNERPFEPRERDYALVGSFYVFCIWIGMGSYALVDKAKKLVGGNIFIQPAIVLICLFSVPFLMAFQNWDDHDRSDRYTAQAMAKSYLDSVQEDTDAIIFTIGDNDTFALWYAQEIEGYRTDVRTINTSLLATDWYIDQMKRKTYESNPIPSQLTHSLYAYGVRDYIKHEALLDSVRWDIKNFVDWIGSDHPRTKYKSLILQMGEDPSRLPLNTQEMVYYPTNKIRLSVNKANVLKSGVVKPKDADLIVPFIDIDLPKSGITKNQMMMLDILANNNWERPIYFTGGSYSESEYIWMKDYLQLDGLVYKLVPIKTSLNPNNPYLMGRVDSDLMYDIVMKWDWGNSESDLIYHDPETRKNSISFRSNMARLAEKLLDEGKNIKAKKIIDLATDKMPLDYFGYYSLLVPFIDSYYLLGEDEKARRIAKRIAFKYHDRLEYFTSITLNEQYLIAEEIITEIERYRTLLEAVLESEDENILSNEINRFVEITSSFIFLYGGYDFYTSLREFPEGYYVSGEKQKARDLIQTIVDQYVERFELFSRFAERDDLMLIDEIKQEILDFRELVDIPLRNNDKVFGDSIKIKFENSMKIFLKGDVDNQE
ncbi:MAG: DUF2723 domain-containing protein [Bacteroidota bacterium]|nr:DUF2723 domain-containing protein [Bacteroidota bacterium]